MCSGRITERMPVLVPSGEADKRSSGLKLAPQQSDAREDCATTTFFYIAAGSAAIEPYILSDLEGATGFQLARNATKINK